MMSVDFERKWSLKPSHLLDSFYSMHVACLKNDNQFIGCLYLLFDGESRPAVLLPH